jgi:hypothetical protein
MVELTIIVVIRKISYICTHICFFIFAYVYLCTYILDNDGKGDDDEYSDDNEGGEDLKSRSKYDHMYMYV